MFKIVDVLSKDIVIIDYKDDDRRPKAMWGRTTIRKPKLCADCKVTIKKGKEAFLPVGNLRYRYMRICIVCIAQMAREFTPPSTAD